MAVTQQQTPLALKFLVPKARRAALVAELTRHAASFVRTSLAEVALDTDDLRLAQNGLCWTLRRQDRRWTQSLQGTDSLQHCEHEAPATGTAHDAAAHAGTPLGERLLHVLQEAKAAGLAPGTRYQTTVRRTTRRMRTQAAIVTLTLDEGWMTAADLRTPILELELRLVSGPAAAMLALAERWRQRFGLIHDPRSRAERGDRLAAGASGPALRKARLPGYARAATATQAFTPVLDDCLAQINVNTIGLIEGDPALCAEHVHQLRVGMRRLRSALRCFRGWTGLPPTDLVDPLHALFTQLGLARDTDVLGRGVMAELAQAGAPAPSLAATTRGPDPRDAVMGDDVQRTLLAWVAWRVEPAAPLPDADDARTFHRLAERRLKRWHRRIVADANAFDALDDEGLHSLRKRIKSLRYAVEFLSPVLRRREVERYLRPLATVQDSMGVLNDLLVARDRYQTLATHEPATWFALGWLAARIAQARAATRPELEQLAMVDPPRHRRLSKA